MFCSNVDIRFMICSGRISASWWSTFTVWRSNLTLSCLNNWLMNTALSSPQKVTARWDLWDHNGAENLQNWSRRSSYSTKKLLLKLEERFLSCFRSSDSPCHTDTRSFLFPDFEFEVEYELLKIRSSGVRTPRRMCIQNSQPVALRTHWLWCCQQRGILYPLAVKWRILSDLKWNS